MRSLLIAALLLAAACESATECHRAPYEQRVAMWRAHLDTFMADTSHHLTPEQRQYVLSARERMPEIQQLEPTDPRALAECESAYDVLGSELADQAVLRGPQPDATVPACECATGSNYNDCGGGECRIEIDCKVTWFGCGCWGLGVCNGMCE